MTARSHPSAWLAAVLAVAFAAPVPAGARRGAPTYPRVQAASVVPEYAAVLDALDPTKPESIIQAGDAALRTYAKSVSADADAVFRQFQAFYESVLVKTPYIQLRTPLNDLLNELCAGQGLRCRAATADAFLASNRSDDVRRRAVSQPAVAALTQYRSAGIWFFWGEGDWYAAPEPAFISAVAARLPLGELGEWVRFWAAEAPERVAEDAGILVGWEGVRRRLARWEAFARAHPTLPETQVDALPHVANLIAMYVFGISNTRAYDTRSGETPVYDVRAGNAPPSATGAGSARDWTLRIDPQLKSSYDRFLVQNRDSAYYTVIDGIVTRLRRSNGAPTRELVDFLRAELTDPYFKQWFGVTQRWLR